MPRRKPIAEARDGAWRVRALAGGAVFEADEAVMRAAQHWIRLVRARIEPIIDEAAELAPRRTEKFAAGLYVDDEVTRTEARVTSGSRVPYARYVHWSRRTRESLDREVARWGGGKEALESDAERRAWKRAAIAYSAMHGDPAWRETMREEAERKRWKYHGHGAPNEQLAGKNVYTWMRQRIRRQAEAMAEDMQRAVTEALEG